uniref:Uncharacterized protein n=1 Tax=Siphoviridae sp. ctTBR23 TaxID=2825515 RepID=A0A8S5NZ82_9CAUD|nr:MAG TPA: hypothetical protein [Siphoviridae sp. ctTBR23]
MHELHMPKQVFLKKWDVSVRPYLTSEDIVDIAESMLLYDNKLEQHMALMMGVLERCTDIDIKILEETDVDRFIYSGLWADVRENIAGVKDILEYVEYKESANVAIAKFVNTTLTDAVVKLTELISNTDIAKVFDSDLESLRNSLNLIKEDGNAEILKNVFQMSTIQKTGDKIKKQNIR